MKSTVIVPERVAFGTGIDQSLNVLESTGVCGQLGHRFWHDYPALVQWTMEPR